MPLKAEVYLCYADVPELSTYRHIYATVSRCASKGVYDVGTLPTDVADRLLKRGELLLTELDARLSDLIGVGHLENYQYLRIVLIRESGGDTRP